MAKAQIVQALHFVVVVLSGLDLAAELGAAEEGVRVLRTGYEPKNSEIQRIMEQRGATQEEFEQLAVDPALEVVLRAAGVMDLGLVALYLASATFVGSASLALSVPGKELL